VSKTKRKYLAIETMESGITAYIMINSLLDMYDGTEHPHIGTAKFVAKATLNELLQFYVEKNSEEQLQALIKRLSAESDNKGSDDSPSESPSIPSI
jgi:hypothetical protein